MKKVKNDVKRTSCRRAVDFVFEDAPGKEVFLAGSFNNWQMTTPMSDKKIPGVYTRRLLLEPGEYQYKFVVNGWAQRLLVSPLRLSSMAKCRYSPA